MIKDQIEEIEEYGNPMDEASFGYEYGVLITGNHAKEILQALESEAEQNELCPICKTTYLSDRVCMTCTKELCSPLSIPAKELFDWNKIHDDFIKWDIDGKFNYSQKQIFEWFKENIKPYNDKEYFEKVYIRDEKDLPEETEQRFYMHIKGDFDLRSVRIPSASYRALRKKIDWYLKPLK